MWANVFRPVSRYGSRRRKGDERSSGKKREGKRIERKKEAETLEGPCAPIQTGPAEKQIFCCDARIHNINGGPSKCSVPGRLEYTGNELVRVFFLSELTNDNNGTVSKEKKSCNYLSVLYISSNASFSSGTIVIFRSLRISLSLTYIYDL